MKIKGVPFHTQSKIKFAARCWAKILSPRRCLRPQVSLRFFLTSAPTPSLSLGTPAVGEGVDEDVVGQDVQLLLVVARGVGLLWERSEGLGRMGKQRGFGGEMQCRAKN